MSVAAVAVLLELGCYADDVVLVALGVFVFASNSEPSTLTIR